MISREEMNPHGYALTEEQEGNQRLLHAAINGLRERYGKPMTVTSGVRSASDQERINPRAPRSKHLVGAAVDILDRDGSLHAWCKSSGDLLEELGLWCEERQGNWQHFQCIQPASGRRWFWP